MYVVNVHGPNFQGLYGRGIHHVERPSDVVDRDGVLIIHEPAHPAGERVVNGSLRKWPARGAAQTIYARGEWTYVRLVEKPEES